MVVVSGVVIVAWPWEMLVASCTELRRSEDIDHVIFLLY